MGLKIAKVAAADMSIRFLLWDQIKVLQQAGHEVVAVCGPGEWVEKMRADGVCVEVIDIRRELSPLADLRALAQLYRLFRFHHFDVVHTHTPKAGLLGPVAARLAGVPVVVHTIHGLLFHDRMPRWKRCLFWLPEKWTAIFSHYLLSQSREDVDVAVRTHLCSRDKISYIGNGIDLTHFSAKSNGERIRRRCQLGLTEDDFVIGSVGRLVYEKGFAELFAAADRLSSDPDPIKFLVVGPEEKNQNDAIDSGLMQELKRRGVIRFLGWRDDVVSWYPAMDLFVLPSHREGIPRACMEASAMQRPVIASDIRGCREVIEHGRTGLLVTMGDSVALAAAIRELRRDPLRRQQMGTEGRRHIAEQFDSRLVLQRLCNFYSRIELGLATRRHKA
jgi:glycosyltransferase involved in cell wall biosynthesis